MTKNQELNGRRVTHNLGAMTLEFAADLGPAENGDEWYILKQAGQEYGRFLGESLRSSLIEEEPGTGYNVYAYGSVWAKFENVRAMNVAEAISKIEEEAADAFSSLDDIQMRGSDRLVLGGNGELITNWMVDVLDSQGETVETHTSDVICFEEKGHADPKPIDKRHLFEEERRAMEALHKAAQAVLDLGVEEWDSILYKAAKTAAQMARGDMLMIQGARAHYAARPDEKGDAQLADFIR
jgi:hypothetical protein